ncbi:MAG: MFS transporter [Candidatus Eremiobacteraeota bacterium]|nr:MFS transporter [Candidatus Eremiobacteraeota bacterium]MCW5871146.1 MFS transporter [Candidatus Eremiobacteraeota bacterium]
MKSLVFLNLANLFEGICYFGMVPLLIAYLQRHFAVDDIRAGWVLSYYVGLVTLAMFPGGALCDRLGARRALIWALGLVGLGRTLLLYSAQLGMDWALLGLTVMATGTGIFQPCVYAAVKDYTRAPQAAAGYSWLYAIMNLGTVLWFLLAPGVRAWGDIEGVYLVLSLVTWANWGFQLLCFRQPAYPRSAPVGAGGTLWNRRFLVFIWLLVPVRSLVAHLNYTLPTAVLRTYPWFYDRLEYCFALNNFLLFVGTPLLTYLTLGRSLMGLMIGGSLVSALSLGFLMLPAQTAWLLAFVLAFSLGEAVWQSRLFEFVAQQAPPGKVGAAMSFANFPWFVAKTAAGAYSGWMLQHFIPAQGAQRPEILWGAYLLLALLTPLSLLVLRHWLTQGLVPPETEPVP